MVGTAGQVTLRIRNYENSHETINNAGGDLQLLWSCLTDYYYVLLKVNNNDYFPFVCLCLQHVTRHLLIRIIGVTRKWIKGSRPHCQRLINAPLPWTALILSGYTTVYDNAYPFPPLYCKHCILCVVTHD